MQALAAECSGYAGKFRCFFGQKSFETVRVQRVVPPVPGEPAISMWMHIAREICGLGRDKSNEPLRQTISPVEPIRPTHPAPACPLRLFYPSTPVFHP
jgi:hypothetical protein